MFCILNVVLNMDIICEYVQISKWFHSVALIEESVVYLNLNAE
jgi:hypothetical protein